MNEGKRILSLVQIFAETFLTIVILVRQVLVIVPNLEEAAEERCHLFDIGTIAVVAKALEELCGQLEQTPGLLVDHFKVVLLRRTVTTPRPVYVEGLANVQISNLIDNNV